MLPECNCQAAVEMAANNRVLILTGGPGTGKTFSVRTIIALRKSVVLASPTGGLLTSKRDDWL